MFCHVITNELDGVRHDQNCEASPPIKPQCDAGRMPETHLSGDIVVDALVVATHASPSEKTVSFRITFVPNGKPAYPSYASSTRLIRCLSSAAPNLRHSSQTSAFGVGEKSNDSPVPTRTSAKPAAYSSAVGVRTPPVRCARIGADTPLTPFVGGFTTAFTNSVTQSGSMSRHPRTPRLRANLAAARNGRTPASRQRTQRKRTALAANPASIRAVKQLTIIAVTSP